MAHDPELPSSSRFSASEVVLGVLAVLLVPVFLVGIRLLINHLQDLNLLTLFPAFLPPVYWLLYATRRQIAWAQCVMLFIGGMALLVIVFIFFVSYILSH